MGDSGEAFEGQVAVVTGGAQGIGEAVANRLAGCGASVAVVDLRQDDDLAERMSREHGARVRSWAVDVRDEAAMEQVCRAVEDELGPIRLLAHCAAVTARPARADELLLSEWDAVLAVNLTGTFSTCRVVGRHLIANGGGSIVTMSSTLGLSVQGGRSAYVASKWGVIGLSKTLAVDWAPFGIRVNIVVPQATETAMMRQNLTPMVENVILPRTPLGRLGAPADIANATVFLLSRNAAYITGSVLQVDGGISTGFYTG